VADGLRGLGHTVYLGHTIMYYMYMYCSIYDTQLNRNNQQIEAEMTCEHVSSVVHRMWSQAVAPRKLLRCLDHYAAHYLG
jgi:hypothetical protein